MIEVKPRWRFKVRTVRSSTSVEKVVKIPNEIADQIGDYVQITIENGRIVIEPLPEEIKKEAGDEE